MAERRYRQEEIRTILELATRPDSASRRPPTAADGLTLADIQSIAVEVGVAPEAISRAAATLDAPARTKPRRSWGMPIEVGHTMSLPRALTDHEWDQLVAELRATFRARGKVMAQGGLREALPNHGPHSARLSRPPSPRRRPTAIGRVDRL